MKKFTWIVIVLALSSCDVIKGAGGGSGDTGELLNPDSDAVYVGHWLSNCIDGDTRIYTEIDAQLKNKVAYLQYSGASCTGTSNLTNGSVEIEEPEYLQNITEEVVEGIPDNFFVLKYTNINDSSVQYVVMFANDSEHYDLTGFTTSHSTWTQWQGEADVYGFADSPSTFTPTGFGHDKIHFTRSELP